MDLLLVRHGIAADAGEFMRRGIPDEARPLTQEGRDRMYEVALGLSALIDGIDLMGVSPLLRAKETADILDERFSVGFREMTHALRPDQSVESFLAWLRTKRVDRVAGIGHEPLLGTLVWYLTGEDFAGFDTGGAVLITFHDAIADGAGKLVWVKSGAELAAMGS